MQITSTSPFRSSR